ncbi:FdhD protein [Thermanaeromonas toyohensis ToBE]|uniref:Sulfur carrier protein FdhD n=1 Tax=Thermanaeromonas toyohensis ToBE TaxID=698762 RepID=A0A1W1V9K3_9FIRM|nr:formate dehydrogenase accessory sulfurtransferase FdhD [Thermanaeromonas toyohensis]SMB90069.1 FdhD protein [Thermanaeromonas toyohensis ToBE]
MKEAPYSDLVVTLFERGEARKAEDAVIAEFPLEVIINGQSLVNLLCTPTDMEDLVVGFLYSEGIIGDLRDITELKITGNRAEARIKGELKDNSSGVAWLTSGCGHYITWRGRQEDCIYEVKVDSPLKVSAAALTQLVMGLEIKGTLYHKTRGAHGAALASPNKGILILREDIGRHNAVDKVVGCALRQGIETSDKLLLTTGRISSEILYKVARMRFPFVVSLSVPSDYAVWLADLLRITIVGFVRGKRFKVYSHAWRVL